MSSSIVLRKEREHITRCISIPNELEYPWPRMLNVAHDIIARITIITILTRFGPPRLVIIGVLRDGEVIDLKHLNECLELQFIPF
jgi:hypothetical protein